MEQEVVISLAHLLTAMKEAAQKLAQAYQQRDAERVTRLKQEILQLQSDIDKML
ncbi:hypothetical protein HYZ97_00595 [Candidatus Pacearchaeota archaeon]|nr:hypothetical protein [Candidatus Pacearchaeota archaeon]